MLKYPDCKETGLELILSQRTNQQTNKQTVATLGSTTGNTVWEYLFKNWIRVEIATCWVLIRNTTSHSTWSAAISPQEEVLLWHRFWQGGWFSLCFQMLCDKSSKTSKHPTLEKKSLDVPTHKLVWVSSIIVTSTPGHVGLETRALVVQQRNTGSGCLLLGARWTRSHLWESRDRVGSLKEQGLVPFSCLQCRI